MKARLRGKLRLKFGDITVSINTEYQESFSDHVEGALVEKCDFVVYRGDDDLIGLDVDQRSSFTAQEVGAVLGALAEGVTERRELLQAMSKAERMARTHEERVDHFIAYLGDNAMSEVQKTVSYHCGNLMLLEGVREDVDTLSCNDFWGTEDGRVWKRDRYNLDTMTEYVRKGGELSAYEKGHQPGLLVCDLNADVGEINGVPAERAKFQPWAQYISEPGCWPSSNPPVPWHRKGKRDAEARVQSIRELVCQRKDELREWLMYHGAHSEFGEFVREFFGTSSPFGPGTHPAYDQISGRYEWTAY